MVCVCTRAAAEERELYDLLSCQTDSLAAAAAAAGHHDHFFAFCLAACAQLPSPLASYVLYKHGTSTHLIVGTG